MFVIFQSNHPSNDESTSEHSTSQNDVATSSSNAVEGNIEESGEGETVSSELDDSAAIRRRHIQHEETSEETVDAVEVVDDEIRIRLKYLNDSQNLVCTHLQEKLGDFKRFVNFYYIQYYQAEAIT